MEIKDIEFFRKYYTEVIRKYKSRERNYNFIGHTGNINSETVFGFFEIFHGDKLDIEKFIYGFLNNAQDEQAVYELIQNAYDSHSSEFLVHNENDHLFIFNNGEQFNFEGIRSILNIGQSTKDVSKSNIGKFGVGFKLVHRLIGNSSELLKEYKGPILFSWNKYEDLMSFLRLSSLSDISQVKPPVASGSPGEVYSTNYNYPWLLKILITNFPCSPIDKVYDLEGNERNELFSLEELLLLKDVTQKVLFNSNKFNSEDLKSGSIVFLELGKGKANNILQNDLKNGIRYSLNILNTTNDSINKPKRIKNIYFDDLNNPFRPAEISTESFVINKMDPIYDGLILNTEVSRRPEYIEFIFGYPKNVSDISIKSSPNFYLYFPLKEESHKFNFILHSNSFHNLTQRVNLDSDNLQNKKLFSAFVRKFLTFLEDIKKLDPEKFRAIYSALLMSDKSQKNWINENFYDKLLKFITNNIPTNEKNYLPKENVKIKDSKLPINPSDFGIDKFEWFYWKEEESLIREASAANKLGLEKMTLSDLICEAEDVDLISKWFKTNKECRDLFLKELNLSMGSSHFIGPYTKKYKLKDRIKSLEIIEFNEGILISINDLKSNSNYIIKSSTNFGIIDILEKANYNISNEDFSKFDNLHKLLSDSFYYLKTRHNLYQHLVPQIFKASFLPEDKKNFFIFFSEIPKEYLIKIELFKNNFGHVTPLDELLSTSFDNEIWLSGFCINRAEYFPELEEYFITKELIYEKIIFPQWDLFACIKSSDSIIVKKFFQSILGYFHISEKKHNLVGNIFLCTDGNFYSESCIYYHSELIHAEKFNDLCDTIKYLTGLNIPNKTTLEFLDQPPFSLRNMNLFEKIKGNVKINKADLISLLKNIFFSETSLFEQFIFINFDENTYLIKSKQKNEYQYYLKNSYKYLSHLLNKYFSGIYYLLDEELYELIQDKNGLRYEKELYEDLLDSDISDEELIDVYSESDSNKVKLTYLSNISQVILSEGIRYDQGSYQSKLFQLALFCFRNQKEMFDSNDAKKFISKVKIKLKESEVRLSEIQSSNIVSFNIDSIPYELELSKILPQHSDISSALENILGSFDENISADLRTSIFKINEELSKIEIYKKLEYNISNADQFAFVLLCMKSYDIDEIKCDDIIKFQILNIYNIKLFLEKTTYYLNQFEFIYDKYFLNNIYKNLQSILKIHEETPIFEILDFKIAIKPYYFNDTFFCAGLIQNTTLENQIRFFDNLFQNINESYKFDKIYINDGIHPRLKLEEYLLINFSQIVIEDNFSVDSEKIPGWMLKWLNTGSKEPKLKFLELLGCKTQNSKLILLRKFLKSELSYFDSKYLLELLNENNSNLLNTLEWIENNNFEFLEGSLQIQMLEEIYSCLDNNEVVFLPIVTKINSDNTFIYSIKKITDFSNIWKINSNLKEELINCGSGILKAIFENIIELRHLIIDLEILKSKDKYFEKVRPLKVDKLLKTDLPSVNKIELNKAFYENWKNDNLSSFRIYNVINNEKKLPYVLTFMGKELNYIYEKEIDIDEKGNIYYIGDDSDLSKLLYNIEGVNGFLKEHIDSFFEKCKKEPEEIAKHFDDIYYFNTPEIQAKIINENSSYFNVNEAKDFRAKLIQLLNISYSDWGNGFVFHFTHIENAIQIINSRRILSRNYAQKMKFKDSASIKQIERTRSTVHQFARFYFRPLTPTQWHNEGLGSNRLDQNPKCPVPIFFKLKIEDIFNEYPKDCFISNGNLSSDLSKWDNSYDFLKKEFDFINLYSRYRDNNFKGASQQEFIVKDYLNLSNIEFEIICRNAQDKAMLQQLLENVNDLKIKIDPSFFYLSNPFIDVESKPQGFSITSTKLNLLLDHNIIIKTYNPSLTKNISGLITEIQNTSSMATITAMLNGKYPKIVIEMYEETNFKIFYRDENKLDWLIHSNFK